MAPATNLGAATPVQIGGMPGRAGQKPEGKHRAGKSKGKGKDQGKSRQARPAEPTGDTMSRKAVSDATAYIRGLAQLRGRNVEWAEKAVREAVSLPADEAVKIKVVGPDRHRPRRPAEEGERQAPSICRARSAR